MKMWPYVKSEYESVSMEFEKFHPIKPITEDALNKLVNIIPETKSVFCIGQSVEENEKLFQDKFGDVIVNEGAAELVYCNDFALCFDVIDKTRSLTDLVLDGGKLCLQIESRDMNLNMNPTKYHPLVIPQKTLQVLLGNHGFEIVNEIDTFNGKIDDTAVIFICEQFV